MRETIYLSDFNPARLKMARSYQGMDFNELSKASNLSVGTLIDFERGIKKPDANQLAQLYWSLEFPMKFFCQEDNFTEKSGPMFMCDMKNGRISATKNKQTKLF